MKEPDRLEDLHAVLLLVRGKASAELARVLWPALLEVERFYGPDRLSLVRRLLTPEPISFALKPVPEAESVALVRPPHKWKDPWDAPVPTEEITGFVRKHLERPAPQVPLIVVTDLEITPPEGWNYVIWWDDEKGGQVVSIPPTDPGYWGTSDKNRLATIKHRVRTGLLSIVGELLGLERCSNDRCFLYQDVDAASTLDSMMWLGPEHHLAARAGQGFARSRREATRVQEVVPLATPETAA
jgi:hypothetical protein